MYFPIVIWTSNPQLPQALELSFPQLRLAQPSTKTGEPESLPPGTMVMLDVPPTMAQMPAPNRLLPWLAQHSCSLQKHDLSLVWTLTAPPYTLHAPHGRSVRLSKAEALLLHVLAQAGPNTVVERLQLHAALGHATALEPRPGSPAYQVLNMRLSRLRRKALSLQHSFKLEAIAKQGYCLSSPVHSFLCLGG